MDQQPSLLNKTQENKQGQQRLLSIQQQNSSSTQQQRSTPQPQQHSGDANGTGIPTGPRDFALYVENFFVFFKFY